MPRPIVIAYHLIWTGYGWWLPNDPRGSMSRTIAGDVIAELGEIHHGRRKVQPTSATMRAFHNRAREALQFPLLEFSLREIDSIAESFLESMHAHRYMCYACAIMPDHVHVLIRKHKHQAEEMIENLQEASRLRLRTSGLRDPNHPVWGGDGWKVFLDHPDSVRRTIRYIEKNPAQRNLPAQCWGFVREYDGWPLHPGHSPNSPYARRLREYEDRSC
ncbi:MAG: transposase [Planctomycetota bacterium]